MITYSSYLLSVLQFATMASSLFLKLTFKSFHHFAWPFLALVYPMCASVQAIETDSYAQTKHLISYWILLSLIYLFEYAFMSHLLRFQPWLYIKLMIIFWLTIPDFGRASYVYDNLIRSMKPKIDTWRKCFVEKDNFLMHAERYMKENGSEALEKLIASKNTMCRSDAKMTNEIIATDNKEVLKTNGERLQPEHKDMKDLEAIEEKEVHVTKQDIPVMPKLVTSQNASSVTAETKRTIHRDIAGGELALSTTHKEVQKEWTCALCLVTTTSEKDLNSHLNGMRHRASCEAALLSAKKQPAPQKLKNYQSKEDMKQKNFSNKLNFNVKNGDGIVNKGLMGTVEMDRKNTMWRSDAETTNEIIATDNKDVPKTNRERLQPEHKHIKDLEAIEKKEVHVTKQDILVMPKIVSSQNASSTTVETKGTALVCGRAGGELPQSSTLREVQKKWTCALCSVTSKSEKDFNSHLNGRKHRNSCEAALREKKQPALQKLENYQSKEDVKPKNFSDKLNSNVMNGDGIVNKGLKGTIEMDRKVRKNLSKPVRIHNSKLMCVVCNAVLHCEANAASHINGKNHLAKMQSIVDSFK